MAIAIGNKYGRLEVVEKVDWLDEIDIGYACVNAVKQQKFVTHRFRVVYLNHADVWMLN